MFIWVKRYMQHSFLESFAASDSAITETVMQLQTLRGKLLELYTEVELAIHATELLEEHLGVAKQRMRTRINGAVAPREFTATDRQREG